MSFAIINNQGYTSGAATVRVYDSKGRLKVIGGGTPPPPAPVVWGSITGLVTNQTDLINYLGLNFYPLSSNPAGYITQAAADLLYYPLTSNPAGYITSAALTGYVPTTRTLTINGTSYDLSADRSWTIPAGGTVTSIGMTVPSAFSVTPGSITVSGTFAITGVGTISQYIDGTGALQTFPTIPTVTPSALTKTDDTNVTLTLGGTPATSLLQAVSLTLGWSGTLATGRGGTGLSTIGAALQYLRVNSGGTGLEYATFPTIPTVTPSALTKTDDTNVTLTLGGTPTTSLLQAVSLTLGWTGTLSTGRGGTGLSTIGTSLQYLRVNSGGTALEYATFPTVNTYTVDNGLTETPAGNFQLGGTLLADTGISGDVNQFSLTFDDMYVIGGTASFKTSFTVNDGTTTSSIALQPAIASIGCGVNGSGSASFAEFTDTQSRLGYLTPTQMVQFGADGVGLYVRTPTVAATTATVGQVLTLVNATTGEAEWDDAPSGGGGLEYGIASGTNTYTVTIAGVTGYVDGDTYAIKFTNGNDDDSTININGLGAKTLTKQANIQVTGGDIISGQELILIYDGTNFQCIGVAPNQLFAFVTNDDSVTITKGQPVYAFGSAGNRMSVKLAFNTSDATSAQTVGLVFSSSIAPNQRGFIITQGVISGVNTAAYSPGATLYLGATAGTLTSTKPFAPNHMVYLGTVERANAGNGQIYVRPQNGFEMNEIHDVQSNGAVNKDILYRDTTVTPNLWKPASIDTILGYTPVPTTRTLTINGTGYDLSADRSWTIAGGGGSATIGTTIDGSGGTITVGQKGYVQIPYACTIDSWRIIANASGSIVVDVWKAAAPTIPTVANTITGSALPTLSTQQTAASSTLTGWTTSVAANDIIGFNVNSATTVSWVILQIFVTKI
jgi:hypothetical protein